MPSPSDVAVAWLVGEGGGVDPDDLAQTGVVPGAAGVLRRLLQNFQGDPVGPAQQLAVGAAVAGLAVPDLALSATITIEAVSVRCRFDGPDPTAAVGLLLPAGTLLTLTGRRTLQGARFIGTAAGAIVNVVYWT